MQTFQSDIVYQCGELVKHVPHLLCFLGGIVMRIIKRSGTEVAFDISKIVAAVEKANKEVVEKERLTSEQIREIAK